MRHHGLQAPRLAMLISSAGGESAAAPVLLPLGTVGAHKRKRQGCTLTLTATVSQQGREGSSTCAWAIFVESRHA